MKIQYDEDHSGINLEAQYKCLDPECSGNLLKLTFRGADLVPVFDRQNGKLIIVVRKCPYCRGRVELA